jgi:hypothetical protein
MDMDGATEKQAETPTDTQAEDDEENVLIDSCAI